MNIILMEKPHLSEHQLVPVRTFAADIGIRVNPGLVWSHSTSAAVGKDSNAHVLHVGHVGQVKGAIAKAIQTVITQENFFHFICFDFNWTSR